MKPGHVSAVVCVGVVLAVAVAAAVLLIPPQVTLRSVPRVDTSVDPGFPIDVVYTWVDGGDGAWRKAQDAAKRTWFKAHGLKPPPAKESARRDPAPRSESEPFKDELELSVASVARFAPWVRTVWIFTQRPHRPAWLETYTGPLDVRVAHHDEAFGPGAALPSYNGLLNTSQVHHIPGLAEHFVLMDDDYFLGRPLRRSHWFEKTGAPVHRFLHRPFFQWFGRSQYDAILRHSAKLLRRVTDVMPSVRRIPLFDEHHTPLALRRSTCRDVEAVLGRKTLQGMGPFRTPTTYNLPTIAANVEMARRTSRRPAKGFKAEFLDGVTPNRLRRVLAGKPHTFCINSGFDADVAGVLDAWLNH